MPSWDETFETGPEGAEITTSNTGLTAVEASASPGFPPGPADPVFVSTPALDTLAAAVPPPPSDSTTGSRFATFTYLRDPSSSASGSARLWLAAPRGSAFSTGLVFSLMAYSADSGTTSAVCSFFSQPAGHRIEFLADVGSSETTVVEGDGYVEGWWEFGGSFGTATWSAYAKDPSGVTIWSSSGATSEDVQPRGVEALAFSDRVGVFTAVDNMHYEWPGDAGPRPVRMFPRHDGQNMSSAPRIVGGYT